MSEATFDDICLLVRLVRGDSGRIERGLTTPSASLGRLAEAAVAGGFSVVLLRALQAHGLQTHVSTAHVEALEARCDRQRARSRLLLEALPQLSDKFSSAGLPLLLLKGPYLASRFYGDIDAREFVDLDLLVPGASRARACRLLESAGYTRRSRVVLGESLTSRFVHGFDFALGGANVDLHWCLSRHPSIHMDESGLWQGRQSYPVAGRVYDVLGDGHEVVFEALSLLRDIERGRPKIKNVLDLIQVASAIDASIDWDGLLDRGRTNGTFGPLVNVLGLCLDGADAHDLAPRLSAALARHDDRLVRARPSGSPLGFAPAALTIGNKGWSARVYDTPAITWFLWWALSLPFRMAVHRRPPRPSRAAD